MIIIVNLPSHSTSDSRNAQGWEFAHLMSMQITRFLSKAIRSQLLISSEGPERIAHF